MIARYDSIVSVSIALKHGAADEIQALFADIKAFVAMMVPDPSILSLVIEGSNLVIGLNAQ